jgi:hypothetical protein
MLPWLKLEYMPDADIEMFLGSVIIVGVDTSVELTVQVNIGFASIPDPVAKERYSGPFERKGKFIGSFAGKHGLVFISS